MSDAVARRYSARWLAGQIHRCLSASALVQIWQEVALAREILPLFTLGHVKSAISVATVVD
ncbi:hypothetical protein ACLBOM_29505 [Escherichia coli]